MIATRLMRYLICTLKVFPLLLVPPFAVSETAGYRVH